MLCVFACVCACQQPFLSVSACILYCFVCAACSAVRIDVPASAFVSLPVYQVIFAWIFAGAKYQHVGLCMSALLH